MLPVLLPEESAAWDRRAEADGIALATLMECAGRAAATVVAARYQAELAHGIVVAAGTGNNGGDGWVLARALARTGVRVWVASLPGERSPLTASAAAHALSDGVRELASDGPWPAPGLVVDAILGTGAKGAPRPPATALLARIHDLGAPVVAIDGPTGVDLGTGVSHVPSRADLTITFGGLRRGHLMARDEMGTVVVVDIGHPPSDPRWPRLATARDAAAWQPELRANAHKGTRGRVVVVGGDVGMSGAIRLAGRAAFIAGAGLVHAVAPQATVDALILAEPDLQTLAHDLAGKPDERLAGLLDRADVVVIGPGLGRTAGRREFVLEVLRHARRAVVDADALTVFQGQSAQLAAAARHTVLVLTPHLGEFRTLFPEHAAALETDPWAAAMGAAAVIGATVLLKGVPTVIARPGAAPITTAAGNPGLATGGSGDLLGGFIGTLLAQGLEPHLAATSGALILGTAAERAAAQSTARSMRPMDVLQQVPALWQDWATVLRTPAFHPPVLLELPPPQTL